MWHALCDKATGDLRSLGTVLPEDASPWDVIELGTERPDLAAVRWNDAARAFEPCPAPVLIDRADELRDRLQAAFQANTDFMTVFNSLTNARKTALRDAMLVVLRA